MMLYFEGSTRADIVYVVYQRAHFFHAPKRYNEIGV